MTSRLGCPSDHFHLSSAVARKLGFSFAEAVAEGKISPRGYADLITRCRACPFVEDCANWIEGGAKPDGAPTCCLNKDHMDSLSRGQMAVITQEKETHR